MAEKKKGNKWLLKRSVLKDMPHGDELGSGAMSELDALAKREVKKASKCASEKLDKMNRYKRGKKKGKLKPKKKRKQKITKEMVEKCS